MIGEKPRYQLRDLSLRGNVLGHVQFNDGERVTTTHVERVRLLPNGRLQFETENSVYDSDLRIYQP